MGARRFLVLDLPEDLTNQADPLVEFGLGEMEVADEAAESFLRRWVVAFVDVAATFERLEQDGDEAFALAGWGDLLPADGSGSGFRRRFAH